MEDFIKTLEKIWKTLDTEETLTEAVFNKFLEKEI